VVEPLKPARGGFLRPFGCGWFIREFLSGHGPNGSPKINPDVGAPQADIFYHYKTTLLKAIALDRATRQEEKQARREKRSISPENIERLTEKYLARSPYKSTSCRYHSFIVYFSNLVRLRWVEFTGREEASAADFSGRVDWKHLMKNAALHKFDVLLVWKIDRAFRSVIHAANTLSMLRG